MGISDKDAAEAAERNVRSATEALEQADPDHDASGRSRDVAEKVADEVSLTVDAASEEATNVVDTVLNITAKAIGRSTSTVRRNPTKTAVTVGAIALGLTGFAALVRRK